MTKTVVNLTQQALTNEIESILDSYTFQPYHQAFAIPDLRQELIAYVLRRIPCTCSTMSNQIEPLLNYKLPYQSSEQKLQLENLIHQGICSILPEKSEWINRHLPANCQCRIEPSHWFG